jgi:hypothetical protein
MNYLEIVIQGYSNRNNRDFLEKYFFREFKKAEKEHFFEADEFFSGCLKVTEGWKNYLQKEVSKRKRELQWMLNDARSGTLAYDEMEGKTIEQKNEETIQYCLEELKNERADGIGSATFYVHLNSLTKGRISYHMPYSEVLDIEIAIMKAFKKAVEQLLPQPTSKQKQKQKLSMNQIALLCFYMGLQITRDNGNEIAEKFGHKSGDKLYQCFTKYSSTANRKGDPGTEQMLKNKIKLIESVIELLPIENQQQAKDELSILKTIYESEYQ